MLQKKQTGSIDLHMHSAYSADGEYAPARLAELCAAGGVSVMALADHNCVRGVPQAVQAAGRVGVRCIPAGEFDCTFGDVNLHLLGYGVDANAPVFAKIEESVCAQEKASSESKLLLTNALGFALTAADLAPLAPAGIYTGEMFAEALLSDPRYAAHPLLAPYRAGGVRADNPFVNFYWDYYAQGKPCYTQMRFPTLARMCAVIRETGGLPVLAHPGVNLAGRFDCFEAVSAQGLAGVEAFSSYHNRETSAFFAQQAERLGLLVTCGSDFHGKTKPSIRLGQTGCFPDESGVYAGLAAAGLTV